MKSVIDMCMKGNLAAQKEFYYSYADDMFRLCCRYVKDIAEAEDVLMKGFMKIYSSLDSFEWINEAALYGWIKKIMVNECLMYLRKAKLFYSISEVDEVTFQTEEIVLNDLECEDIFSMIQKLPTGYRTVINLYVVEGYSHKEIAVMMHITEGASKSQLSKARSKLKILLQDKGTRYAGK